MPRYIIERNVSGVGSSSQDELCAMSQKSREVLRDMGPEIQWVKSYVTGDKVYCEYIAPSPDQVQEHAERSGFPADKINRVSTIIDPTTAEAPVSAR